MTNLTDDALREIARREEEGVLVSARTVKAMAEELLLAREMLYDIGRVCGCLTPAESGAACAEQGVEPCLACQVVDGLSARGEKEPHA